MEQAEDDPIPSVEGNNFVAVTSSEQLESGVVQGTVLLSNSLEEGGYSDKLAAVMPQTMKKKSVRAGNTNTLPSAATGARRIQRADHENPCSSSFLGIAI